MGKVVTKAWLRNNQDLTRLADGRIAVEQVRQQEQELIVDTGARAVGLPLSIIEQLGLPATREVTVTLSDGSRQERQLYGELRWGIGMTCSAVWPSQKALRCCWDRSCWKP